MADSSWLIREGIIQRMGEDENILDCIIMTYYLAAKLSGLEPSRKRPKKVSAKVFDDKFVLSSGILCFLASITKTPRYEEDARSFRRQFRGIRHDLYKMDLFQRSMKSRLDSIETIEEAVGAGFWELFEDGKIWKTR